MTSPDPDQQRAVVHALWAGVAARWAEHADSVDERGAHLTKLLLDGVALDTGDRVLELACGPGGAGLAAAERIGPTGEVVLSDVVPEMAAIAGERAAARGLTNVRTVTIDLEAIDEPDGAFDVVLCREGLMFAVEPARAVREMRRVLRRDGRLGVAVWGPREQNPWLGLVFDAVTEVTGIPVPPPGAPGPFALADAALLRDLIAGAGFTDVSIDGVPVPLQAPSFDAWWARTKVVAGPIAALLARLDGATVATIEQRLRAATAPYTSVDGLDLPGLALLLTARRSQP